MIDYSRAFIELWERCTYMGIEDIVCSYCRSNQMQDCPACPFDNDSDLVLKAVEDWYNKLENKE